MSVYHIIGAAANNRVQIGYSIAEIVGQGNWVWNEEGVIDPNQFYDVGLTDPSVAFDGGSGDFLVCAVTRDLTRIVVARYDASTGLMGQWVQVSPTGTNYDKAWIVAGVIPIQGGNAPSGANEFYITYQYDGHMAYLRSTDGGATWRTSCSGLGYALTNLNDCGTRVPMFTWPVPRVFSNRPLYVAYLATDGIRLLRGDDVNFGAHAGEVQFTQLLNTSGQPIAISQWALSSNLWSLVPSPGLLNGPRGWGVDLAVDPTNANRLYVVYHDLESETGTDMNIYMRVLTKVSGAIWSVGPRLLVADDSEPSVETDQIHPSVKVDVSGRIHVIYYDDQDFTQDDGPGCSPCPRYDVKFAYSIDQGQSWSYQELCDDPPTCTLTEPAVDHLNLSSSFWLGDYIGIDISGGRVWTSFMGSTFNSVIDPNPDKTLIWSSQIVLP